MIKAAIFDLDGTLVDSNDLHAEAWQETFRHFGKEIPLPALRAQIGKGGDQYLPVFLNEREMRTIGEAVEKFRGEIYQKKYLAQVKPFPCVRELFERLRASGKKVALASSGVADELDHYRALAHIDGLIDAQTTKDDVARSKPAPDIFLAALHNLGGVAADEAIVIGDSPFDIQAARKIGLATIALLCGGFPEDKLRAMGAAAIFRDPADLLKNLQRSPLAD
ncbi:MAG: HAD family phosphatase [Verrucomicrobiota bacterium]|nr:HAD family phosphatase [Verrucomicrobiota bacterium]